MSRGLQPEVARRSLFATAAYAQRTDRRPKFASSPPTPPHQTWAEPAGRMRQLCKEVSLQRLYDSEPVWLGRVRPLQSRASLAGADARTSFYFCCRIALPPRSKDMVRSGTILRRRQAGTPKLVRHHPFGAARVDNGVRVLVHAGHLCLGAVVRRRALERGEVLGLDICGVPRP